MELATIVTGVVVVTVILVYALGAWIDRSTEA